MKVNNRYIAELAFSCILLVSITVNSDVQAQEFSTPYSVDIIRGVVMPVDEAKLATELVAVVTSLPYRDGESFNMGDILIAFDCSRYKAELGAAWSAHRISKTTYQSNKELVMHSAIGNHEFDISEAEMNRTEYEAKAIAARVKHCEIKAPFSGRIVETLINRYEIPAANQPLIKIIDESVLELDLIIPSHWLAWLQEGDSFQFSVDETGQSYPAEVKQIGASVDAVSQTIMIKGVFKGKSDRVHPGMSGSAIFQLPANLSHSDPYAKN